MKHRARTRRLAFALSRVLPLTLLGAVVSGAGCSSAPPEPPSDGELGTQRQAMAGIEGMIEYSLDAPWRMEPRYSPWALGPIYGAIPIQITIDDADQIADDTGGYAAPTITQVCQLDVTDGATSTTIPISGFTEIERTRGDWTYPGTEQPNGPPRDVCTATSTTNCSALANVAGTSEWHALAMYTPHSYGPGADVPLTLQLKVMRGAQGCADTDPTHSYRLINHVRVHYGEAPLPRFAGGWSYGDVHYHSQGTDNEGEDGYNYRGVTRAMEAIGLDFVYATDHASASNQIVDADVGIDGHILSTKPAQIEAVVKRGVLRDMDARRFRALSGAVADTNRQTALRAASVNPRLRMHLPTPQIFLGGEVDVIPETSAAKADTIVYGDDATYKISENLCGGWQTSAKDGRSDDCDSGVFRCAEISLIGQVLGDNISSCDPTRLWEGTRDAQGYPEWLIKDVQALNEFDYGREHMVYLPDPSASDPFVGSFTSTYGGAQRRLVEDRTAGGTTYKGMLPEIEAKKGSVFIAHHMNGQGGKGDSGPDGPPWTPSMLDKAWRSPAVLGLEFWNEDGRRTTAIGPNGHTETGYDRQNILDKIFITNFIRSGLKPTSDGVFELIPWDADGKYDMWKRGVETTLTNGAVSWDRLNMRGLDPSQTSALPWLSAGAPRKMFMAGGSDAHGDFNYRRAGYMIGTDTILDMGIGTPRNLVMTGTPNAVVDPSAPAVLGPAQTLAALRAGHFSITDGPALRIAIDVNGNGVIDDGDTPMGDTMSLALFAKNVPVLVEWASTPEWGQVETIELTVGAFDSSSRQSRLYAGGMGPAGAWLGSPIDQSYLSRDGQVKYDHATNGYWFLDNPNPPIDWTPGEWATMLSDHLAGGPADLAGVRSFNLDLTRLSVDANGTMPDRLFVRAVALGRMPGQPTDCTYDNSDGARAGKCIRRYAFSNPIWVMRPTIVINPIPVNLGGVLAP